MPPQFIPSHPTLDSFRQLSQLYPIGRMVFNSFFVAVASTIGQLITCSMAGYVFARMQFRGKNAIFFLYLATMMVPFQVTITPLFILMRIFGWVNTYQGIIFPAIFSAVNTYVLRNSFEAIPRDYEESAVLDGANPWQIFWNIILPLAKPGLATVTVLGFMNSWNAFLWPLFITRDPRVDDASGWAGIPAGTIRHRVELGHGRSGHHHRPRWSSFICLLKSISFRDLLEVV